MKKKMNKKMFRLGAIIVLVDFFLTFFTDYQSGIILPALGILFMLRSFDPKAQKTMLLHDERDQLIKMKVNDTLLRILSLLAVGACLTAAVLRHFSVRGVVAQEIIQFSPVALGVLTIILIGSVALEKYYNQKL